MNHQSLLLHQLLQLGDITYIKKSKENIIKSFSSMDLDALLLLLDDDKSYQDTSKEIFLEKVKDAFAEFRKYGNTMLKPYPGKCASCDCSNFGRQGYCFVGDKSKAYMNLIFEEDDQGVKDIYYCNDFDSKASVGPFNDIRIWVALDEEKEFKPSNEYLIKSIQCENAVAELLGDGPLIASDDYEYWVDKHKFLYESFDLPPYYFRKYDTFYKLYKEVIRVVNYVRSESEVISANSDFAKINLKNEKSVLIYLTRFEDLWNYISPMAYYIERNRQTVNSDSLIVCSVHNLSMPMISLEPLKIFAKNFQKLYSNMMVKYRIETDEDDYTCYTLRDLLKQHGINL